MLAQNLATVRRAIEEAINKGNLSVIDELVASQYVYHEPGVGDLQGPDGLKQLITGYRNAFPDLRLTIEDQIDGGNTVVTRWTATGTHQGELLGIPAAGRRVSCNGNHHCAYGGRQNRRRVGELRRPRDAAAARGRPNRRTSGQRTRIHSQSLSF